MFRVILMPNKRIMVGILLAGKALLKSPYAKRYVQRNADDVFEDL
jgi:hypothetical protein